MIIEEDAYLEHYGILRKSGRYPWGSGGNVPARSRSFLDYVAMMKKEGLSETEIARGLSTPDEEFTTTDLRAARTIARAEKKAADISYAYYLKNEKQYSNVAIGEKMGIPESSVRALLAPGAKDKVDQLTSISRMLKDEIAEKGVLDIGAGVETHLGISAGTLKVAVAMLKEEGYLAQPVQVPQPGNPNNKTRIMTLSKKPYAEIAADPGMIKTIATTSHDQGRTFSKFQQPISIDQKRLRVRYAEEGGANADGVIYVRPGVADLSLGGARYAQVRIMVDGTHYLKGMAVLRDDLPGGVDLVFNTNKSDTGNKLDALKSIKDDPENPFGAVVSQLPKLDANGLEIPNTVRSAMNIVNEEGSWDQWSNSLSSQFLSKQDPRFAKQQLDLTFESRKGQYDEIMSISNPVVKKKLLESFAEDTDSASVHLKAAALPRQRTQVILPLENIKETEIYAPNFKNGERVSLVRFPHGGKFEIPELVVNNRDAEGKSTLGQVADAVGIHPKVAERLSGADFDGDTVLVIPNNNSLVKSSSPLKGLEGFDPKGRYPEFEGMKVMTDTQRQMGDISNLITDMTIKGATDSELARAVRHSMVVIDAEKHRLNYQQSKIDNGISNLKEKYQGSKRGGASTIVSGKKTPVSVDKQKPRSMQRGGSIDPKTGEVVYERVGRSYVNKKGETVFPQMSVPKLSVTKDARDLSSGTLIEDIYADHSNRLKDLANQARLSSLDVGTIPMSKSAKATYSKEVAELDALYNKAQRNRPLERQAQVIADSRIRAKRAANPDMGKDEVKKISSQAIKDARYQTGAEKQDIKFTPEQWTAIQAGAVSSSKLSNLLNYSDMDHVKKLAVPRPKKAMSTSQLNRAKTMIAQKFTQAEIAEALGISVNTLKNELS